MTNNHDNHNNHFTERRSRERDELTPDQLELIRKTVQETLISLGVDTQNPIEVQKDFQHLRDWRTSTEKIKEKGLMALVGVVSTGVISLLWLGIKDSLKLP